MIAARIRSIRREQTTRAGVVLIAAMLTIAAGILTAQLSMTTLLLFAIAMMLVAPLVTRALAGSFDLLEPLVWLNTALFFMFVLRPISHLLYGPLRAGGAYQDISSTFNIALGAALIGAVGLTIGYFVPLGRRIGHRTPSLPNEMYDSTLVLLTIVLIVVALVAFPTLFRGAALREVSTAYTYRAPLLIIPACLILLQMGIRRRTKFLAGVALLLAAFMAVTLLPAGTRLMLLLTLTGIVVYPMLRSGWRPSLLLLLSLSIPLLALTTAMRDLYLDDGLGDAWRAVSQAATEPAASWRTLMTGADTNMFDGLALEMQIVPSEMHFQPGYTLETVLTRPIPRILWSNKPRQAEDIINNELFGNEIGAAGVALSVLGGFYYDSGYVGIFLGMGLIGIAFRALYEYLLKNPTNDVVRLFYASALPLTIVLMRGNIPSTLSWALFTSVPLPVLAIMSARRRKGSAETPRYTHHEQIWRARRS